MEIIENKSLQQYNTFGIPASARFFIRFKTSEELRGVLKNSRWHGVPTLILGGGSNLLFTKNFEGLVLKNEIKGIQVIKENDAHVWIKAGAGEVWHDLVIFSIDNNHGGLENLSLIPGTVGASPIQNIGAYGAEIKDTLESVEAMNVSTLELEHIENKECEFSYRSSIFKSKRKGEFIITSVTFKLSKQPQLNISYGAIQEVLKTEGIVVPTVKDVSNAVINIRRSKLPDPKEIGNAGSFFKNPELPDKDFLKLKEQYPAIPSFTAAPGFTKVPAGWLIEQCGWKGKTYGETGVHKNQALVLVNYGKASGAEIKKLSEIIQQSVFDKFGIHLDAEVNLI